MNGWMDGWMDGWLGGWVGGWTDGLIGWSMDEYRWLACIKIPITTTQTLTRWMDGSTA